MINALVLPVGGSAEQVDRAKDNAASPYRGGGPERSPQLHPILAETTLDHAGTFRPLRAACRCSLRQPNRTAGSPPSPAL